MQYSVVGLIVEKLVENISLKETIYTVFTCTVWSLRRQFLTKVVPIFYLYSYYYIYVVFFSEELDYWTCMITMHFFFKCFILTCFLTHCVLFLNKFTSIAHVPHPLNNFSFEQKLPMTRVIIKIKLCHSKIVSWCKYSNNSVKWIKGCFEFWLNLKSIFRPLWGFASQRSKKLSLQILECPFDCSNTTKNSIFPILNSF